MSEPGIFEATLSPVSWTVPSHYLRWNDGVLEQLFTVHTYIGAHGSCTKEWRPIPQAETASSGSPA